MKHVLEWLENEIRQTSSKADAVRNLASHYPSLTRKECKNILMAAGLSTSEAMASTYYVNYYQSKASDEKNQGMITKRSSPTYSKKEFINKNKKLIQYISNSWNSFDGFTFENNSSGRYRKSTESKSIYASLREAYDDYRWDKKDFLDSTKNLIELKNSLRHQNTIFKKHNGNNSADLFVIICRILQWGGVLDQNIAGKFLDKQVNGELASYLNWIIDEKPFDASTTSFEVFRTAPSSLLSDSGATKIYTLSSDECIIYDDRVAASLGLLISRFHESSPLPESLKLVVGKRSKKGSNRDPSTQNHRFLLKTSSKTTIEDHAYSNLKANWIISEVAKRLLNSEQSFQYLVKDCCSKASFNNELWVAMRIIESALFMAGHSVLYTKFN